jgi:hypothetical protein
MLGHSYSEDLPVSILQHPQQLSQTQAPQMSNGMSINGAVPLIIPHVL